MRNVLLIQRGGWVGAWVSTDHRHRTGKAAGKCADIGTFCTCTDINTRFAQVGLPIPPFRATRVTRASKTLNELRVFLA